ncbi:DNA-binding transcriptional regulator, MocR family, contains an aminotransferase domain [Paenibacillus sp. cl141a]|uniref:aminotransferase-like domain-containing protein n=1 Tax=Paenibacillus sp. cl141a TaxID=1761877 RepID=UPI0008BCBE92|nr:PLP-dependent aminotransferase family protein [Paenibacillus sp. cl141a]SEK48841.1 DNA-binding transcriptional regulator, MocR family, contains an aminotransferase domain [Paenibacillus sp. cl141a]
MKLSMMDEKAGKGTLQQLVYDTVAKGIATGEWKESDKLPSVRVMAERLKVHRLTVLKAYQQLLEDGIVEVKYKSGYFVASKAEDISAESLAFSPPWEYQARSLYVNRSRLSDIHRHQVDYQMSEALIDPALLPNAFLSNHVKQVFDMYPKVLSTYSSVSGDLELREEMARYFMEKQGIAVHPEELLITTGSQQAIDLISRSLVKSGDAVLIERPTYSPAIDVFVQQNVNLLPIEITPQGYDLEHIEYLMRTEKPKLFYMNPTFQNPTGYTVPVTQRKALVELAERYECILVEDEVYHDIYFGDPPPLPFFYYDTEGYVIHIRSFSKYVAPGLRISVLAARPELMKVIVPVKALSDNGTPLLTQKIFQHYFFSSRLQEHVAKLRIALELRKARMENLLAATDWSWSSPGGGLNLWIRLPETINVDALLQQCLAESVAFVPGRICDPLDRMESWIRLSYSYISEVQLDEGIRRLVEISDRVKLK